MSLNLRKATIDDAKTYYEWANDPIVRESSFYSQTIKWEDHLLWFSKKLNSDDTFLYVFENKNSLAGQVRIEKSSNSNEVIIGISIAKNFRGKGFAHQMLEMACSEFWKTNVSTISAYIKKDNKSSEKSFIKAGFTFKQESKINNCPCFVYIAKR